MKVKGTTYSYKKKNTVPNVFFCNLLNKINKFSEKNSCNPDDILSEFIQIIEAQLFIDK